MSKRKQLKDRDTLIEQSPVMIQQTYMLKSWRYTRNMINDWKNSKDEKELLERIANSWGEKQNRLRPTCRVILLTELFTDCLESC